MTAKKLAVFDFDGTIIPFNSFKIFALAMPFFLLAKLRIYSLKKYLTTIYLRLIREISHTEFKDQLILISHDAGNSLPKTVAWVAAKLSRSRVIIEMKKYKCEDGCIICICTAAPFIYMQHVLAYINADILVSYGDPRLNHTPQQDNTGHIKIEGLSHLMNQEIKSVRVMFSDHPDDLPLLMIADRAVLVRPHKKHLHVLRKWLPHAETI